MSDEERDRGDFGEREGPLDMPGGDLGVATGTRHINVSGVVSSTHSCCQGGGT